MKSRKTNLVIDDNVPTAHNKAKYGQIAKRVIMPGDPKRASWIAKTFLKNVKLVSDVRGILCFTGKYKNVDVSVMAHGIGIPSICVYTYELFAFYGVKTIYRVGSCGASKETNCKIGDVILAKYGWSDTPIAKWFNVKQDKKNIFYPSSISFKLLLETAKHLNISIKCLPVISSNFFYNKLNTMQLYKLTKCQISEMESFGLFMMAKMFKKHAACLLTISDIVGTKLAMNSLDRETKFKAMVHLALEAIVKEKI